MEALKILISGTPLFISTIINHFVNGPPQPSWDILSHLTFATSKLLIKHARNLTVEIIQRNCIKGFALSGGFKEEEIIIPNQFRKNAQPYLEKIIKGYEHLISDRWRQFEDDDKILSAKWIYAKKQGFIRNQDDLKVILFLHGGGYILGSADSHRLITTKLATSTNALVLAINYRLAPQNQFPAGLHDAISAYLYLTNPPEDASFKPIDPKRIVIMGDSAGGGLTIATLLALRDSELPMVAGAVCFSPWVDLNHSMPSVIDPRNELTDYLPRLGLSLKPSPAYNEYIKECEKLSKLIKVETETTFWGAPFNLNKQIQLYTLNEAMGIPYVSPLCAESLAGLPPMLIQAGDGERLRDESIYFSFKASQPQKYQLPVYNAGKFEQSPFKTPTNITLEIYEDMPHVFQMLFYFSKPAQIAFQRIGEFTEKLISHATSSPISTSPNDLLPSLEFTKSTYTFVTAQGKTLPLSDEHMKVLEWTEVGKVPPINRPQEETVTNLNIHPLIYLVMVMAMLMFFVI